MTARLDKARTGSYYCNRALEQLYALFEEAEERDDLTGMFTIHKRHGEVLAVWNEYVLTLKKWTT